MADLKQGPWSDGSDAKTFGALVRERRKALHRTQEWLAAEAFPNSERKGYISLIENGKIPNISRVTVRHVARALEIDPEHIPPALRWPEAAEVVKDTKIVAYEIQDDVKKLVAVKEDRSREFGIKEGMLIALARRYAEGSPGDFDAALAGLERALEVARDELERDRLSFSISNAVDSVIAKIDALNEIGDLEAGQAALDAELAALDKKDERRRAEQSRLYKKGITQAVLTRSVLNAYRFAVAQFDMEAPTNPKERYSAFEGLFLEWYERGYEEGLNFDLEVAIALAEEALDRAQTLDQRGAMRTNLGTTLSILGERENGTTRLRQAVTAYERALEERTRERVPLQWALTQMNLGNALLALAERENGPARLEQVVIAYESALKEWTRERVPIRWAMAQMNLGNALTTLGEWESGTTRLRQAVTAYERALEEWTRERAPLQWAMTQVNLGNALLALGKRENGTARLEQAMTAYKRALEERTRQRVPLQWATTQMNLGNALIALAVKTKDVTLLNNAITCLEAALRIFQNANHAPYSEKTEAFLDKAKKLYDRLAGGGE